MAFRPAYLRQTKRAGGFFRSGRGSFSLRLRTEAQGLQISFGGFLRMPAGIEGPRASQPDTRRRLKHLLAEGR